MSDNRQDWNNSKYQYIVFILPTVLKRVLGHHLQ